MEHPMRRRFEGRRAIVTGGASGIGAACARAFAAEGAFVVVADADADAAQRAAEEIGAAAAAAVLDVTDRGAVERLFADLPARHGAFDVLVNSAGIREIVPVLELDAQTWRRVVAVNLDGTFHMSQLFARSVIAAGVPAAIVNLSSSAGLMGVPDRAAYVAAKHAIVGLTREMAMDLGAHRIRVNAVAPGSVRTPLTERYFGDPELVRRLNASHPLGRVADPAEIAAAILFLASDEASFITGAVLPVDGGYTAGKGW